MHSLNSRKMANISYIFDGVTCPMMQLQIAIDRTNTILTLINQYLRFKGDLEMLLGSWFKIEA